MRFFKKTKMMGMEGDPKPATGGGPSIASTAQQTSAAPADKSVLSKRVRSKIVSRLRGDLSSDNVDYARSSPEAMSMTTEDYQAVQDEVAAESRRRARMGEGQRERWDKQQSRIR